MHKFDMESTEHEEITTVIFTETIWKVELRALTLWSRYKTVLAVKHQDQ